MKKRIETMDVNHLSVSLAAIARNFHFLQQRAAPFGVAPTIKANAYGHGASFVGPHLESLGAETLLVTTSAEGLELREAGLKSEIIILAGATWMSDPHALIQYDLTPVLGSVVELEALQSVIQQRGTGRINAHVKIDTGMGRLGLRHDDESALIRFCEKAKAKENLVNVCGIMTHFANADLGHIKTQNERFKKSLAFLSSRLNLCALHISNTAATLEQSAQKDATYKSVAKRFTRPGIALYGYSSVNTEHAGIDYKKQLEPALTWRAPIVARQSLKAGDGVGYGSTWKATKATEIAVVRVGYADGYNRLLSNQCDVILKGIRAPLRGRVCMDLIMIDVSDVIARAGEDAAALGQNVILLGSEPAFANDSAPKNEEVCIDAYELSAKTGTIPYEILCAISARVKRIYVD